MDKHAPHISQQFLDLVKTQQGWLSVSRNGQGENHGSQRRALSFQTSRSQRNVPASVSARVTFIIPDVGVKVKVTQDFVRGGMDHFEKLNVFAPDFEIILDLFEENVEEILNEPENPGDDSWKWKEISQVLVQNSQVCSFLFSLKICNVKDFKIVLKSSGLCKCLE